MNQSPSEFIQDIGIEMTGAQARSIDAFLTFKTASGRTLFGSPAAAVFRQKPYSTVTGEELKIPKSRTHVLTAEQVHEIVHRNEVNKEGNTNIARALGLSEYAVRISLQVNGRSSIRRRTAGNVTDDVRAKVCEMHTSGFGAAQIADEVGFSEQTIKAIVKAAQTYGKVR